MIKFASFVLGFVLLQTTVVNAKTLCFSDFDLNGQPEISIEIYQPTFIKVIEAYLIDKIKSSGESNEVEIRCYSLDLFETGYSKGSVLMSSKKECVKEHDDASCAEYKYWVEKEKIK